MEYELGIDEAGRGPVIGPMVYACCAWPLALRDHHSTLGFADSKQLTQCKREELFAIIESLEQTIHRTEIISSEYISNSMLSTYKVSLNKISTDSASLLVRKVLNEGIKLTEVYVDTVGRPEQYEQLLSEQFPGIRFTVRPKADSLFPVVSAASIVAKVTRDRCIERISAEIGDVGCGYPSDPITKQWLKDNIDPVFGFRAEHVRVSWQTCTTLLSEHCPKVSWKNDLREGALDAFTLRNRCSYLESFLGLKEKQLF